MFTVHTVQQLCTHVESIFIVYTVYMQGLYLQYTVYSNYLCVEPIFTVHYFNTPCDRHGNPTTNHRLHVQEQHYMALAW